MALSGPERVGKLCIPLQPSCRRLRIRARPPTSPGCQDWKMVMFSMRLCYNARAPLTQLGAGQQVHMLEAQLGWCKPCSSWGHLGHPTASETPSATPEVQTKTLRGIQWTHWGLWWGRGERPGFRTQKPYSCLELCRAELCRAEQIEKEPVGGGREEGGCQMDEHQESSSVLK